MKRQSTLAARSLHGALILLVLLAGCEAPWSNNDWRRHGNDVTPYEREALAITGGMVHEAGATTGATVMVETDENGVPMATFGPELDTPVAVKQPAAEEVLKGATWEQKVSLDFRGEQIGNVLRIISDIYKVNLLAMDNLEKPVTVQLRDVSLREAFDTILRLSGYQYRIEGNIVIVQGKDTSVKTRVLNLRTTEPKEVEPVLSAYLEANEVAGKVQILENPDRLILMAPAEHLVVLEQMARELDQRPLQVIIRASIIEMESSSFYNLGITWGGPGTDPASGLAAPVGVDALESNALTSSIDPIQILTGTFAFPGPSSSVTGNQVTFGTQTDHLALDAQIDALVSQGKAKVLSQPRIGVLSHNTAKIVVGREVLYNLETTATGSGNTVQSNQFREAGVTLEVTPMVGDDGYVLIKIVPEVSSFIGDITTADSPPIQTTRAETTVCIKDRQTALIGGLVTRSDSRGESGMPGLRKMPIINKLVSGESHSYEQREMIVLITPIIVQNGDQWPNQGQRLANPSYVPWKRNPEHMNP